MRRLLTALALAALLPAACTSRTPADDAPPASPGDDVARFAVIGDFGNGSDAEQAVAGRVRAWAEDGGLDGLISVGDNVYVRGAPEEFDSAWRVPYGWVVQDGVPVVAVLGNHDVLTDGGRAVMQLMGMPARWYTRTIGPVRFVALDANAPLDPDQLAFLRRTLAAPTEAEWTVAVFHQPAYACGKHSGSPQVDGQWVPLFERYGVDLALSGHDHNYWRFTSGGTTYVVAGGGGAPLYAVGTCAPGTPTPDASEHAHHFVAIEAGTTSLTITAIAPGGRVLDTTTLTR